MTSAPPPSVARFYHELEDDLSDETRELLSSLPRRERAWSGKHLYLYEGSWLLPRKLQGTLACQKHFQARDSDTILATFPKSGTTWLKAMAFALTTRSSTPTPTPTLDHPFLTSNPQDLVPYLEGSLYCETNKLPDLSNLASPRLFATHLPFGSLPASVHDNPSCKVVYLCRNPKDTFASVWHFHSKLRPGEAGPTELANEFDLFCDGTSPYGPFWDHVLGYWKASLETPRKVLFLRYEELQEQPAGQLRRLAEFLECPFSPEEESRGVVDGVVKLCSFDHLRNLEVNKTGMCYSGLPNSAFFRKGKVGDWVNCLTPEMMQKIDRITELKMSGSNLKF